MSNELVIQHPQLPLRAYPKDKLQSEMDIFSKWINDLLGLTGVDAAKRLLIALPAVEKHFWSLGFQEVEKAFTMYVDGQLKTQPLPNYFTRILVGQIFKEYKEQKTKKQMKYNNYTSPEEIEFIMDEAVDRIHKDYIQNKCITESCHHVYDHLFEQGKLPTEKEYKIDIFERACEIRERELMQERHFHNKKQIDEVLNNIKKDGLVKNIAKKLVLEDYFKTLKQ